MISLKITIFKCQTTVKSSDENFHWKYSGKVSEYWFTLMSAVWGFASKTQKSCF